MKRFWKKSIFLFAVMALCGNSIAANAAEEHGTGLKPPTKEEEEFIETLPKVQKVYLNEDALERLKKEENVPDSLVKGIGTSEKGEEIVTDQDAVTFQARDMARLEAQADAIQAIPVYDGSLSKHFPPIGDQGQTGSCTSWSMGYYQLTNNLANVRNLDAKNNQKYRISPAWIHNLCKSKESDGYDGGSSELTVMTLLKKQGAPYWTDFPGQTTGSNFKSWNPDVNVWEKALQNRCERYTTYCLKDSTGKIDLTPLKTILYNGYVVSFSMWSAEHTSTYMLSNKIVSPANRRGEKCICHVQKFKEGNVGHEMTIVGWDDTIGIDFNNDGKADSYGALKVANSWGSENDSGFLWIAYDALEEVSKVSCVREEEKSNPNLIREPAVSDWTVSLMLPCKSYTPLLLAEIELETNSRRELGVELGIVNEKDGQGIYPDYEYIYGYVSLPFRFKEYWKGETEKIVNYDFYGKELPSNTRSKATFLIDLTDTVLDLYRSKEYTFEDKFVKFFVRIEDKEKDGYSSALKRVSIIDRITNRSKTEITNLVVDGNASEFSTDYEMGLGIVKADKDFTLSFNYPIQTASVGNSLKVKMEDKEVCSITTSSSSDRKKIYIHPPKEGYQSGHPYRIYMDGLKTDGGNSLNGTDSFLFYVLGERE